ncbi:hypothetical protein H2199_008620 [Coniosporium tulheliwenetii]|uniref:Uncharacterized protein n=1 Tax=Coniosporium tulheliwenetii TaxID=3383036 RepID=A0ACC2YJ49_9PEZI|nr:hypothetical protein H2199_008620 [Cladosporium sp. JES 115]
MSATQTSQLLEWFRSNGGYLNDSVEVAEDSENIPFIDGVAAKLAEYAPIHVVSYFTLIEQRLMGIDSFWAPYISCLPKESNLNTPLFFSDEDQQWLLGTNLLPAAQARHTQWKSEWEAARDALREQNVEGRDYTLDLYLWAATVFTSRSFTSNAALPEYGEVFPLLYPVLDIANHKLGAKAVWDFKEGSFDLRIAEPISTGDQVFNNYGPKGNEELLMGYGFCIPENPCDEVAIRLSKPPPPVHTVLRSLYPSHFLSADWTTSESTFYLRGHSHYSGGYEHAILGAGGIPFPMLMVFILIVAHTRGQPLETAACSPTARQVIGAIRHLLVPLRIKLDTVARSSKNLAEPKNIRQRYASMYRNGQLVILTDVVNQLESKLESFRQADHSLSLGLCTASATPSRPGGPLVSSNLTPEQEHAATPPVVALHDRNHYPGVKESLARGIILDLEGAFAILDCCEDNRLSECFKLGIESGLGACVVTELRQNDVEDVVWMLWLCAAHIIAQTSTSTSSPIARMVSKLVQEYPIDGAFMVNQDAVQYIEDIRTAASANKERAKLWSSELWTTDVSAWAARVVELEAWLWEGSWVMFFDDPRADSE